MPTHFQEVCEHGTVVAQCRCPGPKSVKIVPCPSNCPYKKKDKDATKGKS